MPLSGARRARCSAAAAPPATTRSPGATRAAPTRSASTSSRTARSPASAASGGRGRRRRDDARASSRAEKVGVRRRRPHQRRHGAWPACACRSRAIRCRRWSPSRSSRCFPCVVMSNTVHAYISQSDKGELVIGAGTDEYNSYTQRGSLPGRSSTRWRRSASCSRSSRRMRMLRNWGGIVDVTPDRSPDHRQDAGAGPLRQLRLGHRRLQGDAGLGPRLRRTPSPATSRTRSTRPSRSSASHRPPDRRGGAAAVAH